jgi:hypothetical protein
MALPGLRSVPPLMWSMPALALLCVAASPEAAQPIVLRTEGHGFSVRVTGIERPERTNHMHGLELSLATADGKPIAGASVVVTGQRLFALNPLPTSPQVRPDRDAGTYRVEGLRFHMAGEWRLVFVIEFAQIRDRFMLNVVVK